jgi:hypothetical protein
MTVEVSDQHGNRLAFGKDLRQTMDTPMCLLKREGDGIQREDIWPTASHLNMLVMLPGGEVGKIMSWWHANDRKEWRWQVEFYNTLR